MHLHVPYYYMFLFLLRLLLVLVPVNCQDGDDELLEAINRYRQSHNLPILAKHDKADCLAEEIAGKMEDLPCPSGGRTPPPAPEFTKYPKLLDKCDIDINTTTEGVVLPVCVPDRIDSFVLTNYTQSQNAKYLNNSKYLAAAIGDKGDWTVVILTTNTAAGSFVSEATCLFSSSIFGWRHYLLPSLLGAFQFKIYMLR